MRFRDTEALPRSKGRSPSNTSASSSVIISHRPAQTQKFHGNIETLEHKIYKQRYDHHQDNEDDEEEEASNFLDMDDDDEDIENLLDNLPPSPPSSPPRELLPGRLYALYDFEGPDPNHLRLHRNDPVELLNDEDNYWWLVKNLNTSDIGFVPAEFVENFDERLARLNCWKNEQHEKSSKASLINDMDADVFSINGDKLIDFNNKTMHHRQQQRAYRNQKKVAFDIKDDTQRSEIVSEVYDYSPLVINKKDSYLSQQNFLVKSLDDYVVVLPTQPSSPPIPPQRIFKEDSIGSFSSDTDSSPIINTELVPPTRNTTTIITTTESQLNNSIKLLDDYINNNNNSHSSDEDDITLQENSITSSNNSLIRNHTATPLTSESYLNDSYMKIDKKALQAAPVQAPVQLQLRQTYHPFVHELFDDLIAEIETLSSVLQAHL